ncbi:MAG: hypothetical protein V4598_05775 [Bdellovibrionota bacterium]
MKLALILAFLFTGLNAFAYSPGGVMVCGKKPTLYSFYEGGNPHLHNIKVWKDERSITRDQYLLKALLRMKAAWPTIFQGVVEIIQKMQVVEVGFVTHARLPEIPFVKKGCSYQEIADRQYDNKFLFVDMNLYPRLSPMGQAGVIIQEALFGYASDTETMDPDFARKFVAKIFSDEELNPKLNTEGMTKEEKKTATAHICTNKMNALTQGVRIYLDTVKLCKEKKDEPAVQTYLRIKTFMQETIDECLAECLWDEGQKLCEDFGETMKMKTSCD